MVLERRINEAKQYYCERFKVHPSGEERHEWLNKQERKKEEKRGRKYQWKESERERKREMIKRGIMRTFKSS